MIPGKFKSDRPINNIGLDKIHLKGDCVQGSIVNGIPETISYNFVLNQPPARKIYKEPRIKLFKKINKHVLSQITFFIEDDDHKSVDFHKKTISFTCRLIKM